MADTISSLWARDRARTVQTVRENLALLVQQLEHLEVDPLLQNGCKSDTRSIRKRLGELTGDLDALRRKLDPGSGPEITEETDQELADRVRAERNGSPAGAEP